MLEWQTLEGNARWPPAAPSPRKASKAQRLPRRWPRWVLAVLIAALLPALIKGYREVRRADQAMVRVENEVRAATVAELRVNQHDAKAADHGAALRIVPTSNNNQDSGVEIRRVEVRGDYAIVEIWRSQPNISWMPVPYRWTRFYHETEQGWVPTEAPDVFYQPLDTLQIGRFTFIYGRRDADAVQVAAHQVEAVDAKLRAELRLPLASEALTVKVFTERPPSLDPTELDRLSDGAKLYVPSPTLLPLPAQITEGDALLQLVAGLLVNRDLDEALAGSHSVCEWQSLTGGLRLWLLWKHSNLPSRFRYNAERLINYKLEHGNLPSLAWYGPDRFACSSAPIRPSSANTEPNDGTVIDLVDHATSTLVNYAMFTLVDYAMSTYGRDRLPVLLEGMRRYDSWETLIPAVFGVSAAEFEVGRQAYLVDHYAVAGATVQKGGGQ